MPRPLSLLASRVQPTKFFLIDSYQTIEKIKIFIDSYALQSRSKMMVGGIISLLWGLCRKSCPSCRRAIIIIVITTRKTIVGPTYITDVLSNTYSILTYSSIAWFTWNLHSISCFFFLLLLFMSRISYSNGPLNLLWEYQLECCFPFLLGQAQVKGDSTTMSAINVSFIWKLTCGSS
jgi:hypothetical protein